MTILMPLLHQRAAVDFKYSHSTCRFILIAICIIMHFFAFTQINGACLASESAADSLQGHGAIYIRSMPTGAAVYFDSVLVGTTPMENFIASTGPHHVSLIMPNYVTKNSSVVLTTERPLVYSTALVPAFGFLSMELVPENARIEIDSVDNFTAGFTRGQISLGWHRVRVSHPDHQTVLLDSIHVDPGVSYEYTASLDKISLKAGLFSALVPGLGQYLDGNHEKGEIEFAATAGAALFMVYSMSHYRQTQSDFHLAIDRYANVTDEDAAITAHHNLSSAVSRMKSGKDWLLGSKIGVGVCYALSIIDALVFHSVPHGLTFGSERTLDYPALKEFSRSPTIRIGIQTPIR